MTTCVWNVVSHIDNAVQIEQKESTATSRRRLATDSSRSEFEMPERFQTLPVRALALTSCTTT